MRFLNAGSEAHPYGTAVPLKKEEEKLYKEIKNVSFWDLMFEHDYYEKYKDYGNLKLLKSLTKKKA